MNQNRRCPKSQQVQSVECSNVAALCCCAGLMIERTQRAALEMWVGREWEWVIMVKPGLGRYNIIDIISYHNITFSRILIFFLSFFNG
jgi:hypothetical protein